MAYIRTIAPSDAEGRVREMYQEAHDRLGYVPNWALAFSLRPDVRTAWAALLKSIQSQVALNADRVTAADIEVLRSHGYRDEEIFDFAAAAAARCFFSKLLDALGVEPDAAFNDLDPALRQALTVGRPIAGRCE